MALAEQEDAILACMFDDGPIGMSLVDVEGLGVVVDGIAPGGLADNQGVPTGAVVHTVAGQSAAGLSKSEIVQIIRSAARPLRMQLHIYASAYPPDDLPSLLQHREPPPLPPPPPPQVQAGDGPSSSRESARIELERPLVCRNLHEAIERRRIFRCLEALHAGLDDVKGRRRND